MFGERITNSFKGIIFGIILFIASFPLIWWNESRSVDRIKTLDEGRNLVVAVSSQKVNANNNNALIHISGRAVTSDILKDQWFGVAENALKLHRIVEMYQWEEHSKTERSNSGRDETSKTTYSYNKTWSAQLIDSSRFKEREGHDNPSSMSYNSETFIASNINVGAFKLTSAFVKQIDDFISYPLSQQNFDDMDKRLQQYFRLNGNEYFYGDPANPQIGAIKIQYSIIKPLEVSVIGKQNNNTIETYYTKNGKMKLLQTGVVGAESMFSSAESENTTITWLIRLGAFLAMWIGLAMLFGPITTLSSVVPMMGSIIGAGIAIITGIICIVLSFITMALAWIFFRPLIGVALLILAGGLLFGGFKIARKKAIKFGGIKMNKEVHKSSNKTKFVSNPRGRQENKEDRTSSTQTNLASGKMGWNPEDHRK